MSSPRRILGVTGSRADYGLLLPVLRAIAAHPDLELQLAVTGSHLEAAFGHTVDAISADGFEIDAAVPLGLSSDDPVQVTLALGAATQGFAKALDRLQPDLMLVLGDRYEILGAVQAALIARVPVAHIAGGDVTRGAFDDAIRHAITKMAHLHFVTTDQAARRVRQLGEADDRVFVTGSPGIDQLLQTPLLATEQLAERLGMPWHARNLAITFHAATLDAEPPLQQLQALLDALDTLGDDVGLVFTGSNADPSGQTIDAAIRSYVDDRNNACRHDSLGQQGYYSLLAHADVVVGNSSSGLYEAPSLGTPTVNIGSRQQGRLKAASVIDCPARMDAIRDAIDQALQLDTDNVSNPYGDGQATGRILTVLSGEWQRDSLLMKPFIDRPGAL